MRLWFTPLCAGLLCLASCVSSPESDLTDNDFGEIYGIAYSVGTVSDFSFPETHADWEKVVKRINKGEIDSEVLLAMTAQVKMPADLNTPEFQETFKLAYREHLSSLVEQAKSRTEKNLPGESELHEIWQNMISEIANERRLETNIEEKE